MREIEQEQALGRRGHGVEQRDVASDGRHDHDPLGRLVRVRHDLEVRAQPLVVGADVPGHGHEGNSLGSRLRPGQQAGSGVVEAAEASGLRRPAEIRGEAELVEDDLGELHRGHTASPDQQVDAEASGGRGHDVKVASAAADDLADQRRRRAHDGAAADAQPGAVGHAAGDLVERMRLSVVTGPL